MEQRRLVKQEEENLREALAAEVKKGNDLRREISSMEAGVVDLRRKAVLKGEECEKMSAALPSLQLDIEENTAKYKKELEAYEVSEREA